MRGSVLPPLAKLRPAGGVFRRFHLYSYFYLTPYLAQEKDVSVLLYGVGC